MPATNDPLLRLQQHAGLPQLRADIPTDTLAEFVYQTTRGGACLDLSVITDDIMLCLDMLNKEVNPHVGDVGGQQAISPALVYAVSGMVLMCLDKAIELQRGAPQSRIAHDLLTAAWRIQCAWDALLAGDIENLREHVATEERARTGGPNI